MNHEAHEGVDVIPMTQPPDGTGRMGLQLVTELRRLRKQAGVSGRLLAERTGLSQSKISRIEVGMITPTVPEVAAWAEAVGSTVEIKDHLRLLTEAVYSEVYSWQSLLAHRPHLQGDIGRREAAALRVRSFQPSIIPGILQNAEYASEVFKMSAVPYRRDDLAAAVAGRMKRHAILDDSAGRFEFLVTEAALRWLPGPIDILVGQLESMALQITRSIPIGVITHDAETHTAIPHGFVIYDGATDDQGYVTVETIHADVVVAEPADVALYRSQWALLSRMAVFGQPAHTLVSGLITEFRRQMP